MKITNKQ